MPHLDEGMVHGWLEGALPSDEAALVEEHIAGCDECAAAVAEARGLIAASSRILTALDDVPNGVIPHRAPRARPWYMRRQFQAAAALVIVAGTTLMLTTSGRQQQIAASKGALAVASVTPDTAPSAPAAAAETRRVVESPKRESSLQAKTGQVRAPQVEAAQARPAEARAAEARAAEARAADVAAAPAPPTATLRKATEGAVGQRAEQVMADAARQRLDPAAGAAYATIPPAPPRALALSETSARLMLDSPLRVIKIERRIGWGPRTTYEISPGVQVVLSEGPLPRELSEVVVTGVAESEKKMSANATVRRQAPGDRKKEAAPAPVRDSAPVRDLSGVVAGVTTRPSAPPSAAASVTPPVSPLAPIDSIQWTDPKTGQRFTLSGPLTREQLELVKARLTPARR